jgi:CSLREA domain-containing protein
MNPRILRRDSGVRGLLTATLATAALGLAAAPAAAVTVTVNTTVDQALGSCSATCSLRDAVATAAAGDTVALPAGTYGLTLGPIQINKTLLIAGAGARSTSVDGNATAQVFVVGSVSLRSPVVEISDLAVVNGLASSFGRGGGIQNFATLTITRCAILRNRAFNGAGLLNEAGAALTVRESAITGNQTTGNGGGGIGNSGTLTLVNSTVSGNSALRNGGSAGSGGGALYNLGNSQANPPSVASFTAINSTLAANFVDTGNGGGMLNGTANVTLINTLVSGNTGGNCLAFSGVTQTSEHSLDGDGTCGLAGSGDLAGVDPLLAALANNGGPTDTQALGAGSPARNAGDSSVGVCPATDQRGTSRPQGPGCDIGSYELVNATPVARCRNLSVAAGPSCTGRGSIDNGSFDPDPGDTITLEQIPAGPYALGATGVTLTVSDNHGAASSCRATVTVADTIPPSIHCPAPITVTGSVATGGARVSFTVIAPDACDTSPVLVVSPRSGSLFPFGTTTVSATATDDAGNSAACHFTVTVTSPLT